MSHKAKVAEYKKEELSRIKKLLESYKVIAVADMTSMPSPQLQKLRSSLKGSVEITMSKGRIIKIAIESLKGNIKGVELLENYMRGMPALLLTNDSPFKLAKILRKSKSMAPAKAGQIARNDIIVPAGPTSMPPGPVIGEFGAAGIKAGIEDGKIAIKADKVVTKEGEVITAQIAGILARLGIEPMEIGINILAACENGVIFTKDILNVDETEYLNRLKLAASNAFGLTLSLAYITKQNIKALITKAFRESNALADSRNILTSNNLKQTLGKSSMQADYLLDKLNLPELKELSVTGENKKKFNLAENNSFSQPEQNLMETQETENKILEPHKIHPEKKPNESEIIINEIQKENLEQNFIKQQEPKRLSKEEEFKLQETVAQELLKKVQEEKLSKQPKLEIKTRKPAKTDEAGEIFKKLQEEKIKKL